MGQRHQIFLIARIIPHGHTDAKYRCIGAFHSQWCFGTLPLKATLRFLTLIKQPDNADIIRHELSELNGKYGRGDEEPQLISIPCPYSLFLLASAWSVDLDASNYYATGMSLLHSALSARMGSFDGGEFQTLKIICKSDIFFLDFQTMTTALPFSISPIPLILPTA